MRGREWRVSLSWRSAPFCWVRFQLLCAGSREAILQFAGSQVCPQSIGGFETLLDALTARLSLGYQLLFDNGARLTGIGLQMLVEREIRPLQGTLLLGGVECAMQPVGNRAVKVAEEREEHRPGAGVSEIHDLQSLASGPDGECRFGRTDGAEKRSLGGIYDTVVEHLVL